MEKNALLRKLFSLGRQLKQQCCGVHRIITTLSVCMRNDLFIIPYILLAPIVVIKCPFYLLLLMMAAR
jgi:hypothetical protein